MNETIKELETLKIELNELRKNSPTNQNAIRIKLDQLGRKYESIQKYNEALDCMKECLEIERQILAPNHIDIASTLHLIGSLYEDLGQLENALKYIDESLKIRKQILPSNDPLIANTLNIFGIIYKKQGKFEESLKCHNESLVIYKQNYPENHITIAKSLNNIGLIYRNQRKLEEGLKYLNQSLEIYNKNLPPTHFSIAETLHNIGSIYYDKENYEEALKYCKKALEIMKQTLPESYPSVETSKHAIGTIYFNQGKYEEALKYLKEGRLKEECLKKLEDKRNQIIHSIKNTSITDQESKINYLLNDLKIRKVKSQISKGNITLQTYIEGINADVLIGRVIDEKYKIDKYLGRGAYGKVYTVLDKNENNNIKVIKLIKKNNDNDEWATEASSLRRLEHNNIVKYHDHFDLISKELSSYPCIITEYCENGDLASRIEKAKNRKENFQDKIISNWIFQASDGLQYLHNMKVIHRDIKPQNILLARDDVIKLADLGNAKVMQLCSVTGTVTGTTIYMSPEMRACLSSITGLVYSYPTDIWSLGCVLYELVFLDYAHKNIGKDHPSDGSPNFSDYIKMMLAQNPDNRITAKNLYDEFKKLKERLDR